MSKKKSLGSSPIGYSSLGINSFEFIPTIVASQESRESQLNTHQNGTKDSSPADSNGSSHHADDHVDKKIFSYYLEENLVERLKRVADEQNMYYSTLVGQAISYWLEKNGFE